MKRWLVVMAAAPGFVAAASLAPEDFAYERPLRTAGSGSYFELTLTPGVVSQFTRRDFGDLRVFDAKGAAQPHAWRPEGEREVVQPKRASLPIFPLPARALAPRSNLSIDVTQGQARIRIDGAARSTTASEAQGYLFDARAFAEPIAAIEIDWAEPSIYQGRVNVEASDDLALWSPLAQAAPVLRSTWQGQTLSRQRLEWPARSVKYLRLTWPSGEARFVPSQIVVEAASTRAEPPRHWQAVSYLKKGDAAGEFIYEAPEALPVDRLRLGLAGNTVMLPAEILVRDKEDQVWSNLVRGVFYRVEQDGLMLQSPELSVSRSQHKQWLLRIDPRVNVNEAPVLELGWLPARLVFLAQGEAPYRLAYGARKAGSAALPIATLVPDWDKKREQVFAAATLGDAKVAGGDARRAEAIDWKRWMLWAVLVAGVALLAWIAWGLVRETGRQSRQ